MAFGLSSINISDMKKTTILLFLISNFSLLFSQNFQLTWQQCYGGSEQDQANDIIEVTNGYLIVGWTKSNDGDISFNHGILDGWLIKTDSIGNILWKKTYGGSSGDGFVRITPDNNGNYFLIGGSGSSDGDISNDPYPDSEDFWIVKIDIEGNIIWDKIVGGNAGDIIYKGSPTLDGGVLLTGWTYSNDGDVSVNYGGADTWSVKISSDGELEWDFTIGTDWIDKGQAILQTSDGGYLIASSSSIHEDAIGNITCTPHSYGWAEAVLFKLDSNLNIEWQHCYGGSDHDGITTLIEISDGYVFGAYTTSNDGDVSGWHGDNDQWIVKIDFSGNIIWQKCLGGSNGEFIAKIFKNIDGSFTIIGETDSNDGDVSGNHGLSEYNPDIWFEKISSEGELLYQKCFGGISDERIYHGAAKKDNNDYVIAAYTDYGPSYDVACTPHGGYWDEDWWVFEIKDCDIYTPATPETPAGDDTVCSGGNTQTVYATLSATNAWSYQWKIEPEEAGTITGDSLQATIQWTENYEGSAAIMVRGINDCGEGIWSQPRFVQVVNCLGIAEQQAGDIRLKVYPNPAREFVVFELNKASRTGTIVIYNSTGTETARLQTTGNRTTWHTGNIKPGLFFYRVETEEKVLSGKIVISGG